MLCIQLHCSNMFVIICLIMTCALYRSRSNELANINIIDIHYHVVIYKSNFIEP